MMTRKIVDLSNTLYLLEPMAAPLWTLMTHLKTADCVNTKIEWLMQQGRNTVREHNYCQIFKKTAEVSKLFIKTKLSYNPHDRSYVRKKKGIELLRDFEAASIFGERKEDLNMGIRRMGGIVYFNRKYSKIKRRRTLNISESEFEILLREIFRQGSAHRTFFYGRTPKFMKSGGITTKKLPTSQTYGIPVYQYLSQHGTVNMVKSLILDSFGIFVEMSHLGYRSLKYRGPVLQTNTQLPGDDIMKDTYLAEWTMEVRGPQKGAVIGTRPTKLPKIADFVYKPTLDEILGLE